MSDFAIPWTTAHQAPPSMGFSKQEYWSGVPLPSPYFAILSFSKPNRRPRTFAKAPASKRHMQEILVKTCISMFSLIDMELLRIFLMWMFCNSCDYFLLWEFKLYLVYFVINSVLVHKFFFNLGFFSLGEYISKQNIWVWRINLPYDPAVPLLGIYPERTTILKDRVPQCSLQRYEQ